MSIRSNVCQEGSFQIGSKHTRYCNREWDIYLSQREPQQLNQCVDASDMDTYTIECWLSAGWHKQIFVIKIK